MQSMRPTRKSKQRATRQKRGLALLRQGHGPSEVAHRVGVTRRTVHRWQAAARHGSAKRKPATRSAGRPCYLSAKQVTRLEAVLQRGARAYGYADDYWTLARIARVIWKLFGIHYHPGSVWRVLRRMGWSCQKPQRVAFRHDDAAIAHWQRYIWPRIKKVARAGRYARI